MKLTIAQALKQKNKLAFKLQKNWGRIHTYNSAVVESYRPFNVEDLLHETIKVTQELVELKTKIHEASAPVREKIFRLSELKSAMQQITSIPTKEGKIRERYDHQVVEMEAIITAARVDVLSEQFEQEIDQIQELLEVFNHKTYLS